MTSPGPCRTHCGSGVKLGGNVEVGTGVSDGGMVGVNVGNRIGVMVGGMGEGRRLAVQVGSIVGVGGMISVNPPHPRRNRANPETKLIVFRVMARRLRFVCTPRPALGCPLSAWSLAHNGWFKSQRMRRPSRVSQGAMI